MGNREREGAGSVVLGLSFDFHDAAAAVVVEGQVVAAAEEERFTRRKHDASLPRLATEACLAEAGIGAADVDHVVFYEKPISVASRYLAVKQRQGPSSAASFVRDAPKVFGTNLLVGYRVASMLADLGAKRPPRLSYVEHHLSHAAAAFLPSPFERAAILTIDGLGEWATATIGHGTGRNVTLIDELRYPDSLGLVYSFVTAFCGFRPNDDEYKVMGLAPYGEPRYLEQLRALAEPTGDGSVKVDGRKLGWYATRALRRDALAESFGGAPRDPEGPITQREADLAASVQALTEEVVLAMADRARDATGEEAICLAGGVALNCVANGRLLREGPFDRIWIQPAAGDAGSAIGAALAYWHLDLEGPRRVDGEHDAMHGGFLGPSITDDEVAEALAAEGLPHRIVADDDELAALVVERLAADGIVGWARGRMEFGPRALGHRSLLADPRSTSARQRLNAITKGRESFRPFAPVVLAERAAEWFELDHPSPYMLLVAPVREERMLPVEQEPEDLAERGTVPRSEIPACTHVDGSARIQTVAQDTNPDLHRLLAAFDARTGVPVLVNTSFNRAGEPIVCTATDAIRSARAAQVDLLVVGRAVVEGSDLQAGSGAGA